MAKSDSVTVFKPKLRKVALVLEDGFALSTVGMVYDAFAMAGVGWNMILNKPVDALFAPKLVSVTGGSVKAFGGMEVSVSGSIHDDNPETIIIMPSAQSLGPEVTELSQWLRKRHAENADIASTCVGAFRLAASGLLDGLTATTHWAYAERFKDRFPDVTLLPARMVLDNGNLFCSGGMAAAADLSLFLIAKYAGHAESTRVARSMLLDGDRESQSIYAKHLFRKVHGDHTILELQDWLESHLAEQFTVDDLANRLGLTLRTFQRRFKSLTGETPRTYIQNLRLEYAKEMLETTVWSFEEITARVGYFDANSFGKFFKKTTGLSPGAYRNRYKALTREW